MFNDEKVEKLEKDVIALKGLIGEFEDENKKEEPCGYLSGNSIFYYSVMNDWLNGNPKTLVQKHVSLQKAHNKLKEDFLELDHKFDLLERFLQVEYFKIDEKTATYDWANKTSNEGFRKTKSYEAVKKEKEKPNCTPCDCDD